MTNSRQVVSELAAKTELHAKPSRTLLFIFLGTSVVGMTVSVLLLAAAVYVH